MYVLYLSNYQCVPLYQYDVIEQPIICHRMLYPGRTQLEHLTTDELSQGVRIQSLLLKKQQHDD